MAQLLAERDFDVAGVQTREDGPVIGLVEQSRLVAGVVRDHLELLSPEHLISDGTSLPTALSVLRTKPRVFVLVGSTVRGIVTRTDLNKPAVRIFLFSLVSLLEMHLAFWVRAEYQGDSWQAAISQSRLEAAKKIQNDRLRIGQTSQLIECLQMGDKRDLLLKRKTLCQDLGFVSKKQTERFLTEAERLRNLLAHGQHNLVDGTTWDELIGAVEWLERVVRQSDLLVEKRVASARQKLSPLWLSA
jgi:hypothetical protein